MVVVTKIGVALATGVMVAVGVRAEVGIGLRVRVGLEAGVGVDSAVHATIARMETVCAARKRNLFIEFRLYRTSTFVVIGKIQLTVLHGFTDISTCESMWTLLGHSPILHLGSGSSLSYG